MQPNWLGDPSYPYSHYSILSICSNMFAHLKDTGVPLQAMRSSKLCIRSRCQYLEIKAEMLISCLIFIFCVKPKCFQCPAKIKELTSNTFGGECMCGKRCYDTNMRPYLKKVIKYNCFAELQYIFCWLAPTASHRFDSPPLYWVKSSGVSMKQLYFCGMNRLTSP